MLRGWSGPRAQDWRDSGGGTERGGGIYYVNQHRKLCADNRHPIHVHVHVHVRVSYRILKLGGGGGGTMTWITRGVWGHPPPP